MGFQETKQVVEDIEKMFRVNEKFPSHICSGLYMSVHVVWEESKAYISERERKRETDKTSVDCRVNL